MHQRFLLASVLAALSFGAVMPVSAGPLPAVHFGKRLYATRLSEPAGGFSYVPPPGWKIRTFPGAKYKISYATPAQGFAPNLNVVDETAAVGLSDYVRVSMTHMNMAYSQFHVLSQGAFRTSSGLSGIRVMSQGTINGKAVRQIFYVFPAPSSRKIIVTASWLASDGNKYTQATDSAMKTFKLR